MRFFIAIFLASANCLSAAELLERPVAVKANEYGVGERIPDVSFLTPAGPRAKLSDFRHARAIVIFLRKEGCSLSAKYAPSIDEIQKVYQNRGIIFLTLNLTRENYKLAAALRTQSSTDVFLLDSTRTLLFRGPLDDQYGWGYSLPQPRQRFLANALDEVLSGDRITSPAWIGPGCVLDLSAESQEVVPPTYHHQIARLLQQNCQGCHRPEGNAPFPLMNFDDAKDQLPMIKELVGKGIMPPWFAHPEIGSWSNDPRLTERNRKTLFDWIRDGAPEGDPADGPLPIRWEKSWHIGKPDYVATLPETTEVPARGVMSYQYMNVATHLPKDTWVEKIEIRPSDPSVVHHILAFIQKDEPGDGPIPGFFAAYAPGQTFQVMPKGMALRLPKGATLLFQIHYQPTGKATRDQPKIGMIFSKDPNPTEIKVGVITETRFIVPAREPNYKVSAVKRFATPTRVYSFFPHMHLRGKAFRIEAVLPEGSRTTVLEIPKYDFSWQLEYKLRTPLDLPAGAQLIATGWFDNSDKNPANPNPNLNVSFGEQTTDEMMIGYYRCHER